MYWIRKIARAVVGVLIAFFVKEGMSNNHNIDLREIDWRSTRRPLHNPSPHPEEQKPEYPGDVSFAIRENTSASFMKVTVTNPQKDIKGDDNNG